MLARFEARALYDKQFFPKCESGIKTIFNHFRDKPARLFSFQ
jgi:hypothetical protein